MEALETLLVYTKNLILYPDEKKSAPPTHSATRSRSPVQCSAVQSSAVQCSAVQCSAALSTDFPPRASRALLLLALLLHHRYRKIKISNIHYQERLGHLPGAIEAMTAIGYQPVGDYLRLDEKKMSELDNEHVLRALEELLQERLNHVKLGWQELPARLDDAHHYSSVRGAGSFSSIGKRHSMEVGPTASRTLRAAQHHRRADCAAVPLALTTDRSLLLSCARVWRVWWGWLAGR